MFGRFCLALASLVFCQHELAIAAENEAPPNFIVINIDDLGYADIGPFGSTLNRTPHLDRMAQEGAEAHVVLCRSRLFAFACIADDRLLSEAGVADSACAVSGQRCGTRAG